MIGDCASCGTQKIIVEEYENGSPRRKVLLCKVCASTFIGNAYFYPQAYDNSELYRVIGAVTNIILQKINTLREE